MTGKICGTGSYIPDQVWDNNHIATLVDTSDEWIKERTGVERRHIVHTETTAFMAAEAGKRAIEDAGMTPEDIDLILVSTVSPSMAMPCTACEVQEILGAVNAFGFDINVACSGFLFAYNTAMGYIMSGMCKNVLVIGAETLSNIVNWNDRNTCILFGDGAGAVVVSACEDKHYNAIAHADGKKGDALIYSGRNMKDWTERSSEDLYVQMDGRGVFTFAVKRVPEVIHEVLEANGLEKEDIDYFILHQANRRIVESVSRKVGVGMEKFPMNLQEYGNTSSASIPILLDELRRNATLRPGQRLVLAGFGGGLAWGAVVVDWNI